MESNRGSNKNYKKSNAKKYKQHMSQVDQSILDEWKKEQNSLKSKLFRQNDPNFKIDKITKVGGLDISVSKYDKSVAVVALVVLDINNINNILYEKYEFVKITQPYVPGFLAFREVKHLKKLVDDLSKNQPELVPDVFLIDGNGILHCNEFGLACHLGVICNIRTIGCGKTVFAVDGITVNSVATVADKYLKVKGDYILLEGKSGSVWGAAVKSTSRDPIIVSIGNRIDLETAVGIVNKVTKFKVTEPIRIADLNSRKHIKKYDWDHFVKKDEIGEMRSVYKDNNQYSDEYYFSQI